MTVNSHTALNKPVHDHSLAKQKYLNGLQLPKDKYTISERQHTFK